MTSDISSLMNGHLSTSNQTLDENAIEPLKGVENATPDGVNQYLHHPEKGLKLCAQLIANGDNNTPIATALGKIKSSIEDDFLSLAKSDENTIGAYAYAQLKQLESQINEVSIFPHLEKYYTVAVGGSFSAGKSRFLNSVLGCPSLLPTDTTPTTSIPTYISKGEQNNINALNFYRKKTVIDEEALKAICHAFNQKFGVTFSHLLKLISVERKSFKYPDLVFLDTPGYSKADDVTNTQNNTDENIAREHLRSSDYLIWLVDQQNGTIPQPDIEFIQSLNLKQSVLVVISKADKKPVSQIEQIIETTKTDLTRAEIDFINVIGYSAQLNEEVSVSKQVLTDLLTQVSQGKSGTTILWQLEQIFKNYINYYDSKKQSLSLTSTTIKELVFEEAISADKKQHLTDIRQKTKAQLDALTKQKRQAEKIYQQLTEQVTELCKLLNVKTTMQPSTVALKSMRHKQHVNQNPGRSQSFSFDALLQGDFKLLSHLPEINKIEGNVIKIAGVGAKIAITQAPNVEIIIIKRTLKAQLTSSEIVDVFFSGAKVSIQIVKNNKCVVTIPSESKD
jgi:hypothetical protein